MSLPKAFTNLRKKHPQMVRGQLVPFQTREMAKTMGTTIRNVQILLTKESMKFSTVITLSEAIGSNITELVHEYNLIREMQNDKNA